MNKYTEFRMAALIAALLYVLAGCTGLNTMPMNARGGDTIILAAGSPEGMTRDNITVKFTSDVDGSVIDLTPDVRALLKFYPDKTSSVALNLTDVYLKQGHEPWLLTLILDLPLSIADGGTLPIGAGNIRITCTPTTSCTFPIIVPHSNNIDMAINILPGTGEPNPFLYDGGILGPTSADPASLQAQTQVQVIATHPIPITFGNPVSGPTMGAAEFVIYAPTSNFIGNPIPDEQIVIVAEDITSYSGSQRNVIWKRVGDNITVLIVSPNGMKFTELRFSIVLKHDTRLGAVESQFTAPPSIVSEKLYDLNGDLITASQITISASLIN